MISSDLLKQVEEFVFNLIESKLPAEVVYHNYEHTVQVVAAVKELGLAEGLNEIQLKELVLAAWFHDVGYVYGFKNHEVKSKEIAMDFLEKNGCSKSITANVGKLILATRMPQQPKNKMEAVICDADLYHLGMDKFNDKSDSLRTEFRLYCNEKKSKLEWLIENEKFMSGHHYFTKYAQEKLKLQKAVNLKQVQEDLKKARLKMEEKKLKKVKKKKLIDKPDRGIETMWRVTLRNHIKLSDIADTKSNILLSVSAIILSIVLTALVPKLDKADNYYLIFPTGIFLLIAVFTIVFSILATRPKVTSGKFNMEDVKNKKVNLLFFGNFHKMKLEDFESGMFEVMNDRDYLYKSLIKDLYFLGIVLQKKYYLLRIAYNIFMIGIVVSVIAFVVSFRLMRITTGAI